MQPEFSNDPGHYDQLVARQIDQYKETEIMHDLPTIYDYLAKRYTAPRAKAVTGHTDLTELYASYFIKSLHESDSNFLVSIGAGDCWLEIEIVKNLLSKNERDFFFVCMEISPVLIEKARKKIDAENLGDIITVAQIDINKWTPKYSFAGVMAHHALHHFLQLEQLFELIKKNLAKNGRFVTCDIIGRNGHMRWPESLVLTRKIWQRIPRKYKFNHQFQQYDDYFNNLDCSTEGFEGIRAQDILPLLVKIFSFEVFFCYGNLVDPFVDRGFGPNYDPTSPLDTAFMDYIQGLNDKLISDGILKPTCMTAVMVNKPVDHTEIYQDWHPAFAVRDPEGPAPQYDVDSLLEGVPFQVTPEDDPLNARKTGYYPLGRKAVFTSQQVFSSKKEAAIPGQNFLKYGWGYPEPNFTWSICEDAAFVFPLEKGNHSDLLLTLEFIPYRSALYPHTTIGIFVNDTKVKTLQYDNREDSGMSTVNIRLAASLIMGRSSINVGFLLPNRRLPQFESGGDTRSLGLALCSASLSKA